MNGNPWNKVLAGLYESVPPIVGAIVEKGKKKEAERIYKEESAYLKDYYQKSIDDTRNILSGTDPNENTGGTEETEDPENLMGLKDLYSRVVTKKAELEKNPYGKEYGTALEKLYYGYFPKEEKSKILKGGKPGEVLAVNPQTLEVKQVRKPDVKKKEPSTKNWKIFKDDKGIPYWGERVKNKGKWEIERRSEVNETELEDYYRKQIKKGGDELEEAVKFMMEQIQNRRQMQPEEKKEKPNRERAKGVGRQVEAKMIRTIGLSVK